ncbi:hypothetical protein, partial [Pseudoalteromonas sp.]|uniref:hypothetical protein n=1 Tax=Pseudoalteromonas sp. TaxID=53249 RepID=UPI0023558DA7
MGAVISGNGLGLFNSSATMLGGQVDSGKAALGQASEQVFVNAATGNLVIQGKDEQVKGLGLGLGVVRTYNSEGHFDGDNNDQWRLGFLKHIELEGSKNTSGSVVTRTTADGYAQRFVYDTARKEYVSKAGSGADDTLTFNADGSATLKIDGINTKNTQEIYDAAGRLTVMQGPQGHQTTIEYTGERASSILTKTSTGTEKTALIYNAQGLIEKLETQSGTSGANTRVYYGYDANKRLSSVRVDLTPADNSIADGKVYETRYTYDGNSNRVQSVSQSDGTVLTIGYEAHNGDYRVKSLTDGEGNQTLYNYVNATHTRVTIGGAQVDYHFDAEKRLTSVERVDNHQIVKQEYGYNTAGRLHSMTNGLGHQTQYGYDSEGNLTQETDADGVTITRTYNSNNQLTKEQIGTDSTVYVYDTKQRLRFKLDADNRLVEYRYNALGQRVSQHQYTDATYSSSNHSVAALEGFAASQKAHQQRSDYGYDFRGQLNSVSRYSSVTSQGVGSGQVSTTHYVYDAQGRLLQETTPEANSTHFSYDGLGRVLTKTTANQAVTAYTYDDANQRIGTRLASGLWHTEVFDKAGMVTWKAQGTGLGNNSYGTERLYRDEQGRVIAKTDKQGTRSYVLYDHAGQIAATVNNRGQVTRHHYDNAGQKVQTVEYAQLVSTAQWLSATGTLTQSLAQLDTQLAGMANHVDNRTSYILYTAAGKPEYKADAGGFVTQYIYNAQGQLIEEKAYTAPLADKLLKSVNNPVILNQWDNYDATPAGATMTPVYDTEYGAQVMELKGQNFSNGYRLRGDNGANWQAGQNTISWDMKYAEGYTIFISVNTSAGHRYVTYNMGSQDPRLGGQYLHHYLPERTTSGEWATVTRDLVADVAAVEPNITINNVNGLLIRGSGRIGEVRLSGLNEPLSASEANTTKLAYTAAGKVEYKTDPKGYVTRYYYDTAGNEVAQRQYANKGTIVSTQDRLSHTYYDGQGRVAGTLSGDGALTTYTYTLAGQKQSQNVYHTQVRSQVIGGALAIPTGSKTTTSWTYTSTGQVEREVRPDGSVEQYAYDKMGQLVEKQIMVGIQTQNLERYQYDQQGRLVSSLDGNQNAALGVNATDAEIASAASQQGAHIEYDILGNIRISKDREGAQTRYYYDAQGSQRFEIDAQGQVTEYRYNAFNERTDVLRYHTVLSASDISSAGLIGGLVTNTVTGGKTVAQYLIDKVASGEAFHEQLAYNTRGLLALKTDAQGYEIRFVYNAFAQLAKQSQQSHASVLDKQRHGAGKQITDTTFNYDGRGLLTSTVISGAGLSQSSSKTYDAFGRAITVTDGNGNPTSIAHSVDIASDKAGRKVVSTQAVDGATRTIETLYDMLGRKLSVQNATGDVTRYQYDDGANSITVTQPNGTSVKTTRNALGKVASVTQYDAAGIELSVSTYHYDKNANLVETRLNGQMQTRTAFDKNNRAHRVTDANGHQVETQYDDVGRVISKIVDPQGLTLTTSFEHNNHGAQVIKTEQINTVVSGGKLSAGTQNKTITEFDSNGQATSVKVLQGNVVQSQTSYEYDGTGKKLHTTQGSGSHAVSQHYEYDALGRLVKTEKGNEVTTYQYDDNDNVIKKHQLFGDKLKSSDGSVSEVDDLRISYFVYNEANQLISQFISSKVVYITPTITSDEPIFTPGLPPVEIISASGTQRDDSVIPIKSTTTIPGRLQVSGAIRYFEYDTNGKRIAEHQIVDTVHIADESFVKPEDLDLNGGEFAYTTLVNNIKAANTRDKVSVFTAYDDNGRKSLHIDANGGVTQWQYDAQGRVYEVIRWGQRASISDLSKLKDGTLTASDLVKFGPAEADSKVKTLYNDKGQARFTLTLQADNSASMKESRYDAAGQLVETIAYASVVNYSAITNETTAKTQLLSSAQDQQSQLFYDDAGRLRFTVDALGYVSEQRYNEISDVNSTLAHGASVHDNAALKAKLTAHTLSYADLQGHYGSSVLTNARVSSAEYNAAGQLIWTQHADGTTESYTYNTAGLKTSYTNQNDVTWTYDYDAAGRLAFERSPAQTIFNWANGQLSKLTSINITKAFSYDGLGNVTQVTEGAQKNNAWISGVPKATTDFGYDNAGRQTSVRQAATTNAPATETITKYDALGRAVSATQAGVTQLKIYDNAGNVRFEIDGEGNVTERRFNALGQAVTLIKYADETTWQPNTSRTPTLADMVDSQGQLKTGNPANLQVSAGKDRQIDTQYDAAGRKEQVIIGNQTTLFTYNAFNQAVKKTQLLAVGSLTSYTYYNALGQTVATVDAGKYLTTQSYNAFGQVETRTEYAAALTGNLIETTQPTGTAGNATVGHNREIHFHYDDMGRVTYQVQTNVTVTNVSESFALNSRQHVASKTTYDALGNTISTQKTATNNTDIAYVDFKSEQAQRWKYDAVGRLIHTADAQGNYSNIINPSSMSLAALKEYTGSHVKSFGYDAFGNLVRQKEHANRAVMSSSVNEIIIPADSQNDKLTRHEYNTQGQLVAEYDALGNKSEHHYNAMGQLEQTRENYNEWNHQNESYSFTYQVYFYKQNGDYYPGGGERNGLPPGVSFNPSTGKLSGKVFHTSPIDGGRGFSTAMVTLHANYLSADEAKIQRRGFNSKEASETKSAFTSWRAPHSGNDEQKARFTKYSYFKDGQVKYKTVGHNNGSLDISNATWNTYYNAFGEVKKDDDGVYVYNQQGQLWKTTKGDGVLKTHTYDQAGRLTKTTHALNGATDIERDALGQAIKITQPAYNGKRATLAQKHDRWGNTIEIVDALGYTTRAQYNYQNKVIKETLPQVAIANEAGYIRYDTPTNLYRYDANGNLVSKVDANDYQQKFKYDNNGNQILHSDANGDETAYTYDIFGRKVATIDAEGRVTTTTFDKLDRVDETGQFGVIGNQAGQYRISNTYQYDALDNRTHEIDAMGGVKSYKFDVYGNVNYSRDEIGREKLYYYDKSGNQRIETYSSLYTSGNTNKNTRNFDEYGNLQSSNDLGGKATTYSYGKSYGSNNAIATLTNIGENTTETDIGRLIHKHSEEHGQDIKYTYYANGWLKSITDTGTDAYSEFEYDAAGRRTVELKQSWDDLQRVIRHETQTVYDSHGRISLTETMAYNNTNQGTGAPTWESGDIISRVTYQYDAVGNRRSMNVQNGFTGEIKPRENKLNVTSEISFMRGSKAAGMGSIILENDFGVDFSNLKITYTQTGAVRPKPEWLKIETVRIDSNTVKLVLTQVGEIGPSHGDFVVNIAARDGEGAVKTTSTLFKLEAYKNHELEIKKSEIEIVRGASNGGYGEIELYDRNGITLKGNPIEVVRVQAGKTHPVPDWLAISYESLDPRTVKVTLKQVEKSVIGQKFGDFYLNFKVKDADGKTSTVAQLVKLRDFVEHETKLVKSNFSFAQGSVSGGLGLMSFQDLNGLNANSSVSVRFYQSGVERTKPEWLKYDVQQGELSSEVNVVFSQIGGIGKKHGNFIAQFTVTDKAGTEKVFNQVVHLTQYQDKLLSVEARSIQFAQHSQAGGSGQLIIRDANGLSNADSVTISFVQGGQVRPKPSFLNYTLSPQADGSVIANFVQKGYIGKSHGDFYIRVTTVDDEGNVSEFNQLVRLTKYIDKIATLTAQSSTFAQHSDEGGKGSVIIKDLNGVVADPSKIQLSFVQMGQVREKPSWLDYRLVKDSNDQVRVELTQNGYIGKSHGDFYIDFTVTDKDDNKVVLRHTVQLAQYTDAKVKVTSRNLDFTRGTATGGTGSLLLEDTEGLLASNVLLKFKQIGEFRTIPSWLSYSVVQQGSNGVRINFTQTGLIGEHHGNIEIVLETTDGEANDVVLGELFPLKSYADVAAKASGQFTFRRGESATGTGSIVLTDPDGVSKNTVKLAFVQEGKSRTIPSWLNYSLEQRNSTSVEIKLSSKGYIGKEHGDFYIDITSLDDSGYETTTRQLVTLKAYVDKLPSIKSNTMAFSQFTNSGGSGYIEIEDLNGLTANAASVSIGFTQMGAIRQKPEWLSYRLVQVNTNTVGVHFSQIGHIGKSHGDMVLNFNLVDKENNTKVVNQILQLDQYVDAKARITQNAVNFTRGTMSGGSGYMIVEDANGVNASNLSIAFKQEGALRSTPSWLNYSIRQQNNTTVRIDFNQMGLIGQLYGNFIVDIDTTDHDQNSVSLSTAFNLNAYADRAMQSSGSFDFRRGDSNTGSGAIRLIDADGLLASDLALSFSQSGANRSKPSWLNYSIHQVNPTTVQVSLSSAGYIGQSHGDFYINIEGVDRAGYQQSASQLVPLKAYIPPYNHSTSVSSSFNFRRGESYSGNGSISIADQNGLSSGNVSVSFEQSGSSRSKPSWLNYSVSQSGSNNVVVNFSSGGYIGSNHGNFYALVHTTDHDGYTSTSRQLVSLKAYIPPPPPTDYGTSISGSFNFTRGTSSGGSGYVTIRDDNGISAGNVSLSRVQSGNNYGVPGWLNYSVQQVSYREIRVNLSQSGYIGSSHGNFFLKVNTRDNISSSSSQNLYFGLNAARSARSFSAFSPASFSMRSAAVMAPPQFLSAAISDDTMRAQPLLAKSAAATSASSAANPQAKMEEYWFTYDGNNRVVHDGGQLTDGTITTQQQGQYISYNKAGQQSVLITSRNKAQRFIHNSWGQVAHVDNYLNKNSTNLYSVRATLTNTPTNANWRSGTQFEYDAVGRVTENRQYFDVNRYEPYQKSDTEGEVRWTVHVYYGGALKHISNTRYNAAGEVTRVEEKALELDIKKRLDAYVSNDELDDPLSSLRKVYVSEPWTASSLKTQSISQDYKYKVAGRVDSYAYYQKSDLPNGVNQLVHRFNKQYEGRDTYLESTTFGSGDNSHKDSQHLQDAQTRSSYDANGNRTRIEEHITDSRYTGDKKVNARYMRFDAEGKLLSKVTGEQRRLLTDADLVTKRTSFNLRTGELIDWQTTVAKNVGFTEDTDYAGRGMGSYHLYSGSNYLGEINKSGSNSIKEQHFKAPGANDASIMARHQVQGGDTLKGIAKLYYGSEDLWYVIADLNGLGAGSELLEGVMLDIPARANNFNSHDNFKPMNLGEIVGNTDPSLPYIPPPPEAGCNAVASIVMIAVAVVATIATAGAAAAAMGGVAGATTTMGAGMAVLGGAAVGTGAVAGALGVAAAAIGGFVGSVASQVVGKAMGAVDSFSLKGALASGLTAGATAGMGQYLQGADWANNGKKSIDAVTGLKTLKTAGKTVMGASSAISSVAANKLVGNQASFRWGNVAASALTSAVAPGDYGAIGKEIMNPISG